MNMPELHLAVPEEAIAPIAVLLLIVFALVGSVLLAVIYGTLVRIEQLLTAQNKLISDAVVNRALDQTARNLRKH